MSTMYTDLILDRYKNPANKGKVENPDISSKDWNPLCGDVIEISISLDNGKIKEIKFNGEGCVISQVSADMLMELINKKNLEEVSKITKEDLLKILGIELSPLRLKCALLPLKVLKIGVYDYMGKDLNKTQ